MGSIHDAEIFLKFLLDAETPSKQARLLLYYSTASQIKAISEIFYNLWKERGSFSDVVNKEIASNSTLIKKLSDKTLKWKIRKDLISRKRKQILKLLYLLEPVIIQVLNHE